MWRALELLIVIGIGFPLFFGLPIYLIIGLIKPPKNQTRLKFIGRCFIMAISLLVCLIVSLVVLGKYRPTPEEELAKQQAELAKEQQVYEVQLKAEQEQERIKAERYLADLKAEQEREKEREKERNTSKSMLMTRCQTAIMPTLKNPKSFEIDFGRTEVGKNGDNYVVNLAFYATNGLNANILSMARCEFDENGNILKAQLLN